MKKEPNTQIDADDLMALVLQTKAVTEAGGIAFFAREAFAEAKRLFAEHRTMRSGNSIAEFLSEYADVCARRFRDDLVEACGYGIDRDAFVDSLGEVCVRLLRLVGPGV